MEEKVIKASRPGEYVAFFTIEAKTMEGPAFAFLGCDAFTAFAFNIGIESDESPESIIKHIYLLTEDIDFLRHRDKGFTLVLDRYEELADQIERVIQPVNGRLLFDKKYHRQIAKPVRESLGRFLKHGRM